MLLTVKEERVKILIAKCPSLSIPYLSRLMMQKEYQIVATLSHKKQLLESVKQRVADVIIFEFDMLNAHELIDLQQLNQCQPNPALILGIVSHSQQLDFQPLIKSDVFKLVLQQDLQQAFDYLTQLKQSKMNNLEIYKTIQPQIQRQQIVTKTYRGVEVIPIEDIYYFLADQKYIQVRHKNGSVLIDETLKELEIEFANCFIRIHRNALVALHYLDGLELVNAGQYQVRLHQLDDKLAISRRHLPSLRAYLQQR